MRLANYKQKLQQFREAQKKKTNNRIIQPTIKEADLKKYFSNIKPPTIPLKDIDTYFKSLDYKKLLIKQ